MQRKNDQVSFCTKSALICTGEDVHVVENALLSKSPGGKNGIPRILETALEPSVEVVFVLDPFTETGTLENSIPCRMERKKESTKKQATFQLLYLWNLWDRFNWFS